MISELLPDMALPVDVAVTGITDDSREIEEGDLFVAVQGHSVDGRAFISHAVHEQASAVLAEPPVPVLDVNIPVIEVEELGQRRGEVASRFFGEPTASMLMVGVTGTNGKTSCTHFIAQLLNASGKACGVLGTLGYGLLGAVSEAGMTTPGGIELQRRFRRMLDQGADAIAFEASSHGLAQGRLNGTALDMAVFTNLTRDHLDYHDTFADYLSAKRKLFEWRGLKATVLNRDDPNWRAMADGTNAASLLTFSTHDHAADVYCASLDFRIDGFEAEVITPWGVGAVSSRLLGEFNVSNLLAAITVLGLLDHDIADICRWASQLESVPGRMDMLPARDGPSVVIDYAHTPDALEKALSALVRHKRGRLFCVVGCGGDRDSGKRPVMGECASRLADWCVFTSDNPRSEEPGTIIQQMLMGVADEAKIEVIEDRGQAIRHVLEIANDNDMVLIAGKGHEEYQVLADRRVPFSDYREVAAFFEDQDGGGA